MCTGSHGHHERGWVGGQEPREEAGQVPGQRGQGLTRATGHGVGECVREMQEA